MQINPIVIDMDVGETPIIPMQISTGSTTIGMGMSSEVNVYIRPTETYEGSYEITPKAEEAQVLETEGLLMKSDLTVKKIPYFETTNPTGTTVYIAREV